MLKTIGYSERTAVDIIKEQNNPNINGLQGAKYYPCLVFKLFPLIKKWPIKKVSSFLPLFINKIETEMLQNNLILRWKLLQRNKSGIILLLLDDIEYRHGFKNHYRN